MKEKKQTRVTIEIYVSATKVDLVTLYM